MGVVHRGILSWAGLGFSQGIVGGVGSHLANCITPTQGPACISTLQTFSPSTYAAAQPRPSMPSWGWCEHRLTAQPGRLPSGTILTERLPAISSRASGMVSDSLPPDGTVYPFCRPHLTYQGCYLRFVGLWGMAWHSLVPAPLGQPVRGTTNHGKGVACCLVSMCSLESVLVSPLCYGSVRQSSRGCLSSVMVLSRPIHYAHAPHTSIYRGIARIHYQPAVH